MKIMVGYDKSNASKEAVKYAKKHAVAFNAKVYIVTSVAQSRELEIEDIQKVETGLKALKRSFKSDKIDCEAYAKVSALSPGECLVEFAMENDIDEIFIGVRRRSKVGKLLLGSNAQYVILKANCPVVAVKLPRSG